MKNWSAQEKKDRRMTCHQMSITKRLHDCSHDAFERYRIVGYEDKLPQLQWNGHHWLEISHVTVNKEMLRLRNPTLKAC